MTEHPNENQGETIVDLIERLSSKDPVVRERARDQLVKTGGEHVTQALIGQLSHPDPHVRWEAAKAMTAIADPAAAEPLMHALDDDNEDVRWVAGEALVALGGVGVRTVLNGLTHRAHSLDFCKSAHHVLHDLRTSAHGEAIEPVLKALKTSEPEVTAPPAALNALLAIDRPAS